MFNAQDCIPVGTFLQTLLDSAAWHARFSSRGESLSANQVLSAMRSEFGGPAEQAS